MVETSRHGVTSPVAKARRPSVSVAMATFNGEPFVREQLESWLVQMLPHDEIVVSDDGSSDNTLMVVRSMGDPRIRVIDSKERVGYQRNFERAIRATAGDVIMLSDQDDVCMPERIDSSLHALHQGAALVAGDAIVVDSALGTMHASYFALRETENFSAWSIFTRPPLIGATMASSRSFMLSSLPLIPSLPHDHWLSFRAAMMGKLMVLPQPLIRYRRHGANASQTGAASTRPIGVRLAERARLLLRYAAGR